MKSSDRIGNLRLTRAIDAFVNLPVRYFIASFLIVRVLDAVTAYMAFKLNSAFFLKNEQNQGFINLVVSGDYLPFMQAQAFWFVTFTLLLYVSRVVCKSAKSFPRYSPPLEAVIYAINLYIIGYCFTWSAIGAISNIIAIFGV